MLDLEVAIVMGGKKFPCLTVSPALNCTLCTRKFTASTNESRAEIGLWHPRLIGNGIHGQMMVVCDV